MEQLLLAIAFLITGVRRFPAEDCELIGTRAPQWSVSHWINSEGLQVLFFAEGTPRI